MDNTFRPYHIKCAHRLRKFLEMYIVKENKFKNVIKRKLMCDHQSDEKYVDHIVEFYKFEQLEVIENHLEKNNMEIVIDTFNNNSTKNMEDTCALKLDIMDDILLDKTRIKGKQTYKLSELDKISHIEEVKICEMCGNSAKCVFLEQAIEMISREKIQI